MATRLITHETRPKKKTRKQDTKAILQQKKTIIIQMIRRQNHSKGQNAKTILQMTIETKAKVTDLS